MRLKFKWKALIWTCCCPKLHLPLKKHTRCVHLMLLIFLWNLTGNPCFEPLSLVIFYLIRWLDAVNIPFIWICICLLISYMFCCQFNSLLIAGFSCASRILFWLLFYLFAGFIFSWTDDWWVWCETVFVRCVDTFRSLSDLYLIRLVFSSQMCFFFFLKGLLICRQMLS